MMIGEELILGWIKSFEDGILTWSDNIRKKRKQQEYAQLEEVIRRYRALSGLKK